MKLKFIQMTELTQNIIIDDVDQQLLYRLQQDASQSNQDLARQVGISPPTCLRRIRRLRSAGLIERQVAILNPAPLAEEFGEGLHAILEVTLDRQSAQDLDAFEARAVADTEVSQCWRVSAGAGLRRRPGPGLLVASRPGCQRDSPNPRRGRVGHG